MQGIDERAHDFLSCPIEAQWPCLWLDATYLRVHKEIKRRTDVVGTFPNDEAAARLVGAVLMERNDEWAVSRRYMTLEAIGRLCCPADQTPPSRIAAE